MQSSKRAYVAAVLDCLFIQLLYINLTRGLACMVKKVAKNKKEKAAAPGNSSSKSPTWKHLSPLARAYLKVVKASKQTQEVQTSMSPLLYREMMAGLNTEIKNGDNEGLFKDSAPFFFANNVKLVYDTE